MKTVKIQLTGGKYVDVPEVVIDAMTKHRSEIITTWEQMLNHFKNCKDDCFEIWCRLETGSTPHENLETLDRYVKHVEQFPPDWGNLFHHQMACDKCQKESRNG